MKYVIISGKYFLLGVGLLLSQWTQAQQWSVKPYARYHHAMTTQVEPTFHYVGLILSPLAGRSIYSPANSGSADFPG